MLGLEWTKKLIYGYAIVMKYKEDYFQVSGIQLPDQLKKPFDKKKKQNKNSLSYSSEIINRFQMLYCSHTNRNSGLFRKSNPIVI
jgi:5,10-methylenetetrahydrofolate reductase